MSTTTPRKMTVGEWATLNASSALRIADRVVSKYPNDVIARAYATSLAERVGCVGPSSETTTDILNHFAGDLMEAMGADGVTVLTAGDLAADPIATAPDGTSKRVSEWNAAQRMNSFGGPQDDEGLYYQPAKGPTEAAKLESLTAAMQAVVAITNQVGNASDESLLLRQTIARWLRVAVGLMAVAVACVCVMTWNALRH